MVSGHGLFARLVFHEPDRIFAVDFHDLERDLLVAARGDAHAGIVGADRHFAVAAVDEHGAAGWFWACRNR